MNEKWSTEEMRHQCDIMMAHLSRVMDLAWKLRLHSSDRAGITIQNEADSLLQAIHKVKNGRLFTGIEKGKSATQADTFVCRRLCFHADKVVLLHDLNQAFIDEYGEELYYSLGKSCVSKAVARHFPSIGPAETIHNKGVKVRAFINAELILDSPEVPKETQKIDMPWYDA